MSRAKRAAEAGTSTTLVQLPTPPKIPLQSLEDVRREAARVYREARAGRLETADASRLSFMLQGIAKMIEATTIERRIEALENPTKQRVPLVDFEDMEAIENGKEATRPVEQVGTSNR